MELLSCCTLKEQKLLKTLRFFIFYFFEDRKAIGNKPGLLFPGSMINLKHSEALCQLQTTNYGMGLKIMIVFRGRENNSLKFLHPSLFSPPLPLFLSFCFLSLFFSSFPFLHLYSARQGWLGLIRSPLNCGGVVYGDC